MKRDFLVPVFLLGFLTVLSSAQVDISPGVARISLIQGDVATQRGDTGDWAAAALNQPLVGGDRISTGDNSKAELQLDHANILRLGNNSQAKIATVERVQNQRAQIQVQIWQGLAYYSVFKDSEAEVEIDTPNAAIRPTAKDSVYRIPWTWVSHEPWGWTPYHYGRWFLYGKSWMWWPGPVDGEGNYRPEWAPAYVSF